MRAMKDSGVEWIGEIPADWKITKVSFLYHVVLGKMLTTKPQNSNDTLENYLRAQNIKWNGIQVDEIKQMWFSDNDKKQYLLKKGDILVTEGGDVGVSSIYCGEVSPCYIQNAVHRIFNKKLSSKHNNKFFYYWMYFVKHSGYFNLICNKATIQHLTKDKLCNTPIIYNSLTAQQRIAAYLDTRCAKIDTLISQEQAVIEKLKEYKQSMITQAVTKGLNPDVPMKDSGVEWIGKIPADWEIKRMQDIAFYKKGPFGSALKLSIFVPEEDNTYKVYEQKNAIYKNADIGYYYIPQKIFDKLSSFEVFPGEIIVSCAGTIGECYVMPLTMKKGIINQALMKVTLFKDMNSQFFLYLFDIILKEISARYSNGSAIKNIPPFAILKKFKIAMPIEFEQNAIVSYLNNLCSAIDATISKKQTLIDKLTEYKKSLIYEVVTGKKEV